MGTLYECLREARLEQFYPAFRANGITRSEALINLGMPEFCALGITANEDKRRLIELVNIIKSVHSSGLSDSPVMSRRMNHSNNSPTSGPTDSSQRSSSQTHNRGHSQSSRGDVQQSNPRSQRHTAKTQHDARVPNFSVASYMDMLEYMSHSSDTEGEESLGEEEADNFDIGATGLNVHNVAASSSVRTSSAVRASCSRNPIERIKHSQDKGYNYGVHKISSSPKVTRSARSRHIGEERIKVCVRKRPLTRREQRSKEEDIVTVESTNTLSVNEPKLAVDLKPYTLQHEYVFDEVFDENCSNEDVYIRAARPLISCIFTGGTATCFAYGQTGAGKTHTMLGNKNVPGLYLLAGQDIFSIIESEQYGKELHVWVSFFEIYCGQLFDLLNRRNRLHAREDGSRQVCIAGLTETEATNLTSLVQTLEYGNSVRSKGATGVNPDSSRSHAILQLDIRDGDDVKIGKMSFIDLAGSERASDVKDTDKQTRQEGAEINQSLLALKECIRSIDQESRHTPFRQSKLTHILKDSFVGNSRTCMIANISPSQTACENTLNTLRYADRVKELKRDSVRTSSAVGQAMTLLMNIPPTTPSIFHPSNIQSSSTPLRQPTQSRRFRPPETVDIDLDPSETPIRGHNMPRNKSTTKENVRPSNKSRHIKTESNRNQGRNDPSSAAASSIARSPHRVPQQKQFIDSAASQGLEAPPPEASPSESDHTDTDSCNATNPTYTIKGRIREPMIQSTDTEFDFPTSDFNNIDEINDLNRSNPQRQVQKEKSRPSASISSVTATNHSPSAANTSNVPKVKPVLYRSTDSTARTPKLLSNTETSEKSPELLERKQAVDGSEYPSPQQSRQNPNFKKPFVTELISSDDSVDDEDMFADGPSPGNTKTNNLSKPTKDNMAASAISRKSQMVMIPQPAESTDLACFTQRQLPSSPGVADISSKFVTKKKNDLEPNSDSNHTDIIQKSHSPHQTILKNRSPVNKVKQFVSSPSQQCVSSTIADPLTYSTVETKPITTLPSHSPSFTSSHSTPPNNTTETESQRIIIDGLSPDLHPVTRSRRNSEGSHSKHRRRRTSHSPTGQVSDDSTDSIRASMSDQGQSNHRRVESTHGRIRKERSDPLLALDLQKKKHTLPDSENITKMLNRGNTQKSGLSQGSSGLKVIHSELPSQHSTSIPLSHEDLGDADHGYDQLPSTDKQFCTISPSQGIADEKFISGQHGIFRNKQPYQSSSNAVQDALSTVYSSTTTQVYQEPTEKDDQKHFGKSTVIVQEKVVPEVSFAPIHPEPIVAQSPHFEPFPVAVTPCLHTTELATLEDPNLALQEARMNLVSAHEDQLASITSLCKYEMKLLLNAKKVSGKKGFDDYLRRVNDILQQKMTAITSLHEQINQYQCNHITSGGHNMAESNKS